jgi:hypothetical protein
MTHAVASWREDGRGWKKSFSVAKYGEDRAKALASRARREAVARLLANWKPGPDYDEPRR